MKITIIGWYGTETIGDRAILAGILSVLTAYWGKLHVNLGSLFPFFSQRTIDEDSELWKRISDNEITVCLFDSKKPAQLKKAIKASEFIIMGGGPLMHIPEMHLINYAFKKAKQQNKKTILFGNGIGPIFKKSYQNVLRSIVKHTDLIYLRDSNSKLKLQKLISDNIPESKLGVSHDPAVIPCLFEKENYKTEDRNFMTVNLRRFSRAYSKRNINPDLLIIELLKSLTKQYAGEIRMIPMHYFAAGGDDRSYFYEISGKLPNLKTLTIQDKPLNVSETLHVFADSEFNIGMRYHSVLFQTIMHGNNYILDYTEPKEGKIASFLSDTDSSGFYRHRYFNVQQSHNIHFSLSDKRFNCELDYEKIKKNSYHKIKQL